MAKFNANTDRDSGARDTVARKKPAASAAAPKSKKSIPTPTKRPSPNTASRSPSPANDKQYGTYSTSGGPQSAKKAAPSTFGSSGGPQSAQKRGPAVAGTQRSRSQMNDYKQSESQYSSDTRSTQKSRAAGAKKPNIFNSNSAMPGED